MVRLWGARSGAGLATFGAVLAAALLGGCGSDSPTAAVAATNARGTLIEDPPIRIASADATAFSTQLQSTGSGAQLSALAGKPACGIDLYYFKYWTVGARGEPATASAALMVPTGGAPQCSGPRPIVLYAHGTTVDKSYNIASVLDQTNSANAEAVTIATVYAGQGYIVVAPNFAGYDISSLPYHPFLDADQNAKDMMDALAAARAALPHSLTTGTTDSGQLFVTGYSAGGYVAMATVRAMTAAGVTVTASAPASGPYAMEALVDSIVLGTVNLGSTEFTPLLVRSYQEAYGNVYQAPTDLFEPQYASGIALQLPNAVPIEEIFREGGLPQTALFDNAPPATTNPAVNAVLTAPPPNPIAAAGFGNPFLMTDSFRAAYIGDALLNADGALPIPTPLPGVPLAADPQLGIRIDTKLNDLRGGPWAPRSPMLLCGGSGDPVVFFQLDTEVMASYWAGLPSGLVTVLDVNAAPGAGDPFAPLKVGFQQQLAAIAGAQGQLAATETYHGLVSYFCDVAARSFFSQF